jgi:glutaredoxin-like protein
VGLLSKKDARAVRQQLQLMASPVRLVHFTQELNLEYGREARMLIEEFASLSERLSLDVHDYLLDQNQVAAYKVDKVPATIVRNEKDYGIRFYGLPAGYEFANLLDAVLAVSQGDVMLSGTAKEKLKALSRPLHLEVFVTPTWPHCPQAVRLAHRFAMESEFVTADAIEATEFPELAGQYGVSAVPTTVINGTTSIRDALPEEAFLERILKSLPSASERNAAAPWDGDPRGLIDSAGVGGHGS